MLVLSRKVGELIQIGDAVSVRVVRIGPNSVRLGIEAPDDLRIVRGELDGLQLADEPVSSPVKGVCVPAFFSECGDCRETSPDCKCVVADA